MSHGVFSIGVFFPQNSLETFMRVFSEFDMNTLGYQLMWSGDLEASLAVLTLNNEEYPESANTYDSKGDIYLAMGDTLSAYNHFVTAYKMDENFWISKEKADKLKPLVEGN